MSEPTLAQSLRAAARERLWSAWRRLQGNAPRQDPGLTPTLFLVVDAVPIGVARDVWDAGLMPGFSRPVAQVSVFPSLTNVAVGTLLRPAIDVRPPGYEVRYVHPPSGEVRGGLTDQSAEPGLAPYRTKPEGALGHVAVYAFRGALTRQQARWISLRFNLEGGPWLGYLPATDGVAHFDGRDALVEAFTDVCAQVLAARQTYAELHGVAPHVVLCSDHGMEWGLRESLTAETIAERLRLEGFDPERLGPRGVLMAPMGDVGAGAIWTVPDDADEVARLVAELPGVDLAVAREPGSSAAAGSAAIHRVLAGSTARARIQWSAEGYRYLPLSGDPLGYLPVLQGLPSASSPWLDDTELFEATWHHSYPDALHRIRGGLTDLVEHPASVIFSMKPGWTTGARLTQATAELMGGQQGTHGALHRQQTLGFVACLGEGPAFDDLATVPAIRAEHALAGWRELVRAGSAQGE